MSSPDHFDIIDEKNVHMIGKVADLDLAKTQWSAIKSVYEGMVEQGSLDGVEVISGAEGCEDMVFTANQTFPWVIDNQKVVVLSRMKHPSRQREVPHFEAWFQGQGYDCITLSDTYQFEGMGDLIPMPGKRLLFGGHGKRSQVGVYDELVDLLKVDIVTLELVSDYFYHLDTCFVPLDDKKVMICREAFSTEALKTIETLFEEVIDIPLEEASNGFALNAMVFVEAKQAVIQEACPVTVGVLEKEGFTVHQVETSEYIKSGGSVFCMKMMFY